MEIVMTIAEKVAEPIIDYTVAPIARQVSYLIFYKDNFKNLKDQYTELKRVKGTISHEVEVERKNGRQIYDAVQNWLNRVDEIVEEAEQLSIDPQHRNVACCKGPFPNFKSRHQLSRKAKKMARNIAEVMQQKDSIGSLAFLPDLEGIGSTSATSSEKLESRKKMKEDIVLALRDPHISRVGVYGLGGVGKSTLIKEVAKKIEDDKLFDKVVMANISQVADLERIQREIADFLGLRFEETTIIGRAARLRQRIKKERSILVILDDIWEILELDKLGLPLNDHKGCKLLLISRKLDILQNMETQKDFLIGVLNEEEAWSLFEDMVGDVVKDANLRDVAIQVAKKCAGLTVLIVTVSRALKNKDDIDSWKDALNQLKTIDEEGMSEKIYSALEFSYNHLDGDEMKALFLLCGSVGPKIQVQDLLKYVMGLGIFKHINTPKDARPKLHRLIGSLKASCLLLEDNSNLEVKMHDIVHEVAASIASRDQHVFKVGMGCELKKWPSEEFLQRCTQIILQLCHIPKLPERLECPNIKLFYLYNKNESLSMPNSFFAGMKNLKVLDLTCMHLPSLPQSFHSLVDLQTLCLYECVLGDMTNIGALTNLQILCLHGSSIVMLPNELEQLIHLRMLDLTNSGIEIFPSDILSKLTKLEELYLGNSSIKWDQGDSIEENKNASLIELRHLKNLTTLEIQIKGAWVLPREIMFDKLERYKIVIGDVWEWSDNYGVSKMLKLKLNTVFHLEHGIKELIKGVEDLYLDEVHGISNVLYDLNGEGFPLLNHLHIQNNGKIQRIINSLKRRLSYVFFPKLETLILQNLSILETICDGSFMNNSFARLRSVKVKCCDHLKYLFSVPMVKALCQLIEIEVLECHSMKKIVFVENSFPNSVAVDENIEFSSLQSLTLGYLPAIDDFYSGLSESSTTTMQSLSLDKNVRSSFINSKVKFSNLETLKLSSINLENIWHDDHISIANSFHNLANLSVEGCSRLKYLFSSSIVGSFPNLKQLEIRECEMMEEIISIEGRNDTATDEVGLPKLETLVISNMKRLKKVWHFQFDGLKTTEVNNCDKLINIFPYVMQGTFGSLETLKVSNCGSVEEIFQLTSNEIHIEEEATTQVSQLKKLQLLDLPKLKQIWSKDPQGIVHFHSLQDMHVESCQNIEYLLPFSIAVKLPQLEKIKVYDCGMSEIVANKEGAMEKKVIFHFDRLHSLVIGNMSKLDRFYNGNHSLTCPSLSELWVGNCEKLKLLGRHCTSNQRKNSDSQIQIFMQRPLFVIEEVIPKLEEWVLNNKEAIMILQDPQWKDHYLGKLNLLRLSNFEYKVATTFLDSVVQKAPNLKRLFVENSSLKKIFQDKRVASKEGKNKIKTQLQTLALYNLRLLHICREGCQVDPILEVLEVLIVKECDSLKILVPSSVTFSHLIYLEIEKCNGLINLIYPSTASSLVKLKEMILRGCNSLEEIVTEEMNETRDEIVLFLSLRTLVLESLPRLNCFSSSKCLFKFPFLEKVVVRQCPRMKIFCETETSASMLKKVIKDGKDGEWCWEGNLNGTIKNIFLDKAAFHNTMHLDLSMYPELKDSWYSPVENKMFCNLKSLLVKNCDFISNVLIPSNLLRTLRNLEEIDVSHCDSLQVVFEFDCTKEGGMLEKEAIHLRKISLSNLPKLQYIWKQDCQEIASFGDSLSFHAEIQRRQPLSSVGKVRCPKLRVVSVKDCENLEYLFPFFIAMHAIQLEQISIKNARSMKQIVSDKEGLMDSPVNFEFNHLISLQLWNLYELEGFFSRNHRLLCSLLTELDVRDCAKLKLFKTRSWSIQGGGFESKSQVSMQQPLFTLEEVICNLEKLALNSENLNFISQGQFSVENFSKLKFLYLTRFEDDQAAFPYSFLQNITSLEHLVVEWSSFKEIFQEEIPTDEKRRFDIRARVKKLSLNHLQKLQHISKEGFRIDPILEDLESLYVGQCSNLKHLVPSSVTLSHLTYLEVENCNGLTYLITSSTARSLVKLTEMKIKNCNSLEQVVTEEREGSEDEIAFNSLEVLELECLPIIKRFCSSNCALSLPLLEKVVVQQCPRMSIFSVKDTSTPMLREIQPKEEEEKINWEGDLNRTINKMFVDMVAFHSFKHLELSEYPELRELWYNHVQQEVYGNLNSLVVHKCDFLSDVLLPSHLVQALPNLEKLEVSECGSLEAVFDLTSMDQKEVFVKETVQLKEINLSGLPKLKHIWKQNFQELVNFRETAEAHIQHHRPACSIQRVLCPNLQIVEVDECPNLKYVFSPSLCQELTQLEELHIESCGVEKIVAYEEGLEELKFHFPLLRILWLRNLRQLNDFYPKRYTLECPSLKELNVFRCESLKIYAFEHSDSYQFKGVCGHLPIQQALFHIEKVPENLEEISLTEKDAMRILNGNYEKNLFQRIEILRLQYFQETPIKFLNDLIQKFPATTTFQARSSYFKTLFPSEEIGHCSVQSPPQIKTLWLFLLEKLEHIWNDNSALDTFVPNLEHLGIYECCRLIRLAPPLTSFTSLITLEVEDCNGLMDFMSPFTAKSLVHLTSLAITNCKMLEEIVAIDEGGPEEEISFKSLKDLELTCLPRFKSFCFGKHTFIFPSLVTLKVTGCHKMQNFSSGITVAPFLKLVEVENGKKRWKGDLNTTINHLFLEKTNENLNMDSTEASSFKEQVGESKPNKIADIGKQDTQKSEASSGTEKPLAQVAYSPSTNQDTELIGLARETQEMSENIERPLVEAAKVKGVYDAEANDTIERPLIQIAQEAQRPVVVQDIEESNESKACPEENLFNQPKTFVTNDKIEIIGTQEIHDTINKPLIQSDQDVENLVTTQNTEESLDLHIETQKICDTINRPPIPIAQNVPNSNMIREAGIGKQDTQKNEGSLGTERPLAQVTQNGYNPSTNQDIELIGLTRGTQEMSDNIERPSVEASKVIGVYNAGTKKPLIQIAQEAQRPATVQDIEESNESKACPEENLFNQPKTFVTNDKIETIETQEIHDTIDKPLIQSDQDAEKLATTQNTESLNLHIETQKICDTINRPSIPTAQNVPNSNMIREAATDPSPSQAPEPIDSSIQKMNIYKKYKGMIDIPEQNTLYLEVGMNRHPQVLDWLNTKRRRVFTSSFFCLFADVTHILRTTRKVDLTEDDRNYIKECCTALKGVDFDQSWINYVHGCIEECGDGEDLKRKVEEAEGQASNLKDQIESMKKELASVEESLVLLRDKANKLHDFIES